MCSGTFRLAVFINSQKLERNQMSTRVELINYSTSNMEFYTTMTINKLTTLRSQYWEMEGKKNEYMLYNYIYINLQNRQN